jgi:3-deoxy-D-manno-octulosonic-acid transferase
MFFLYNLLLLLSVPLFPLIKLSVKKRGEVSLLPRLKTDFPGAEGRTLLHLSSIGEVNTARPLIERLKGELAITTFTDYGLKRAEELYPQLPKRLLPLDLYPLTRSFLKKLSPKRLLIFESEVWPSLLKSAVELGVPTYFVSGKVGEKAFKRLLKFKKHLQPIFREVEFLARSSADLERAKELGFKRVEWVGDLKLDYSPPEKLPPLKVEGRRRVLIWGSTHPGEEELAAELHFKLKEKFPNLLTVIAPRHTGRKVNLPGRVLKRSESVRVPEEVDFYLVDTVGELAGLYAYAELCLIGGSFVPGIGGHNPVESVVLKKPTLMGEFATEFKELASELSVPLVKVSELYPTLSSLLSNPELSSKLAESSYNLWREKRGVADRILSYIGEGS